MWIMLICHRFSSKHINVLDFGTEVMVPPKDFFLSPSSEFWLSKEKQNKLKKGGKEERSKDGREGGKNGAK